MAFKQKKLTVDDGYQKGGYIPTYKDAGAYGQVASGQGYPQGSYIPTYKDAGAYGQVASGQGYPQGSYIPTYKDAGAYGQADGGKATRLSEDPNLVHEVYGSGSSVYGTGRNIYDEFDIWRRDELTRRAQLKKKAEDAALYGYNRDVATYKSIYESDVAMAKKQKEQSVKYADISYERDVADARTMGELSRANYGKNAETLAGMGLSGSGYRDYIDGLSYAGERQNLQRAGANRDSAVREASYAEYMAMLEAEKQKSLGLRAADAAYRDALLASEVSYADVFSELGYRGIEMKMQQEERERQLAAEAEAKKQQNAALYAELMGNLGIEVTPQGAEDLATSLGMTYEQAAALATGVQNSNYDAIRQMIAVDPNGIDLVGFENDVKKGKYSPDQIKALQEEYSRGYESDATYFMDKNDKMRSAKEAEKIIEDVRKNPLFTNEAKAKLEAAYKENYGGIDFVSDAKIERLDRLRKEKFATWSRGGERLQTELYRTNNETANRYGTYVGDMEVFSVGGRYYCKYEGTVYVLGQSSVSAIKKKEKYDAFFGYEGKETNVKKNGSTLR